MSGVTPQAAWNQLWRRVRCEEFQPASALLLSEGRRLPVQEAFAMGHHLRQLTPDDFRMWRVIAGMTSAGVWQVLAKPQLTLSDEIALPHIFAESPY